jgi:CheY-like chemotaxis protein
MESDLNPNSTMLIVDDQPELRLLIKLTFSGTGFTVREAADGESALAACAAEMPDVVLLDVMMPGIDGYEVCRRLKSEPRLGNSLVVLMTAGDQATERVRAREAGADLYLPKPFSPAELLRLVTEHLPARKS